MAQAPLVLIMGPPGAGKGTQARMIVDAYSLTHVATGDLLREAVAKGTPLGLKAKSFIDHGDLVPDDVIIGLLRDLVAALPHDKGVLLDGFPRTVGQAESLEQMLGNLDRRIDVVLDIRVPTEVLIDRLSGRSICRVCQRPYNVRSNPPKVAGVCDYCGGELYTREDDSDDAVHTRLQVYEEQTAPVSAFYRDRGVLVAVNGNRSQAEVKAEIDDAFAGVAAR